MGRHRNRHRNKTETITLPLQEFHDLDPNWHEVRREQKLASTAAAMHLKKQTGAAELAIEEAAERQALHTTFLAGLRKPARSVGMQAPETARAKAVSRKKPEISVTTNASTSTIATGVNAETQTAATVKAKPAQRQSLFPPRTTAQPAAAAAATATAARARTPQTAMWQVVDAPKEAAKPAEQKPAEVSYFWKLLGY